MTDETSATTPYGEWRSPISAADVAAGSRAPIDAAFVGDEVWWSEPVPAENRVGVFARDEDGAVRTVLPAPWSARSRVHEYGGGAWAATPDGALVFVDQRDQRIRLLRGGAEPVALTPDAGDVRHAGLQVVTPADGAVSVLAVRERHTGDGPQGVERDLLLVPVERPEDATSVVRGSRFLAQPRLSPDGSRLAWVGWDHPDMAWDASVVRVGSLAGGVVAESRMLAGGPGESALQPEWLDDRTLVVLTDRSGWWNACTVDVGGGAVAPIVEEERETGGPLWNLGQRWYLPVGSDAVLQASTLGTDEHRLLRRGADGAWEARVLATGRSATHVADVRGSAALVVDGSGTEAVALRRVDLDTGRAEVLRAAVDVLPDAVMPRPEERVLGGVHAVVYPPRNPEHTGPAGGAPFVALVHGGPTGQAVPQASLATAYYTSRGIGVVDVNYRGSTGYGRAYREALEGEWGVVDVDDVATVMRVLVAEGVADGARLAVEGGSAGGWTVLSALVRGDVFAAGVSRYGVADLVALAEDTHDFEAHYLDRLVGPYPEAAALYAERAPLHAADRLRTPVLLLQGSDDRVVPPSQSRSLRDALARHGVPHAYIEFDGEGHGFRRSETIVRAREAALAFLGRVLGFVPPGVPALPLD